MIFIYVDENKILHSSYYNSKKCCDYPLEELDYIIENNHNPDIVYFYNKERIFETNATRFQIKDIFDKLGEKNDLREFEMAALSVGIKRFIKKDRKVAEEYFNAWSNRMKDNNPNLKKVMAMFNEIVEPLEKVRKENRNMKENLLDVINMLKIFQKSDYLNVKDEKLCNQIYYKYDKAIELLEEIEKVKEKNYEKEDKYDYEELEY